MGLLLLGKGAVFAHLFGRPLAVEMDDEEQPARRRSELAANRRRAWNVALLPGALAREFYERLLARQAVGVALQDAKRRMVRRHNNPLGLLYTLYVDQDVRLSPARRESAAAARLARA